MTIIRFALRKPSQSPSPVLSFQGSRLERRVFPASRTVFQDCRGWGLCDTLRFPTTGNWRRISAPFDTSHLDWGRLSFCNRQAPDRKGRGLPARHNRAGPAKIQSTGFDNMTPSGHIAASLIVAPLGAGPLGAFFLGAFQHAILDYTCAEFRFVMFRPDGSIDWRKFRRHGKYLALEILLGSAGLWIMWSSGWMAMWAVLGYTATEIPDVIRSVRNPSVWSRGDHLIWWHRPHGGKGPPDWTQTQTSAFAVVLLLVAFVLMHT